ncbi:MAG: hypothetical protein LPK79_07410, partial [Bacteroidota bacterium]|nr:hypothetical protein [Bacteroidota bacterium]
MRKLGLLIIAILGLSFSSQASHLLGGEITWECLPNGQFRFYLTLFRDCSGINLGTSASISSNSPAGSISMSIVPGWPKDVSNDCTKSCTSSGLTPQDGIIQEFKYQSNPITLNGVPPATGWYFYYTSCCRPGGMANTNASNYYLRAIMYPYAINGVNQNTYPCFDNSPNFLEAPRVRTCNGYSYTYNNLASDKELDSLYFAWAPPSDAFSGGTFGGIAFTGGYSYTNPIPGTVTFNNKAGQINITGNNSQGSFVTCMVVEAYKDCQKVAEVYRDIPMIFQNCPNYTNSPPDMTISNLPGFPVLTPSTDSLVWSTTVYAGQQVKFRITANDYDLQPNFLPQNVIFKGSGGQLGIPYTSATNCLYTAPCATIVPVAPQTGYTKPSNNRVEFDWQTNCDHLSYRPSACSSPRSTYLFYLKMEDNACPVPATSLRTIAITVQSTIPQPPDLSNSCVNIQPNGDVSFDWVPPVDTGYNWDYYVIYKSGSRNGPFSPIDTIPNYLTTSYTDVGASNGPAFYVVKHFGGCDYFSVNSDTVAAMNLSITPIPPTNSSVAQLNWFAMHSPDTVLDYEIYRRTTNGVWGMIAGTQDTMYRDTVNICGANLEYQVRVNNSCNSNIVSGFFSDQNNLDVIRIDSVSVANGQSIAAWSQTTQGDATDYIVLKFIQGQGWVPVDTVPVGTQTWTYANSQATTMIENFKVVTMDSCGNVSSELNTKYHRNIWLRSNLDACDNKMRLSWNSYKNWPGGVQEYRVMVDETDDLGNFTPN